MERNDPFLSGVEITAHTKKHISEKHLLRESLLHVAPSALFVGKYGWLSPNLIWELFLLGVLFQAVWGKDLPSKADFSQRLMLTKAGLATSSARSSAAWLQFCQKCGFIGGKKRSFSKWGWNYRTYKKTHIRETLAEREFAACCSICSLRW